MHLRRCLGLLAVALPAFCLEGVARAAESASPGPVPSRSQARAAEISEAVRAKLPKYQPKPEQDEVTMRESGAAAVERDGVLNLPDVVVQARKPQKLVEYEMLTPKGRLELALKRRPGLKIGNFLGLNNGIALALLQEDIEREKRDALKEQVERLTFDDGPDSRELNRVLRETLMRPNTDWTKGRSGR